MERQGELRLAFHDFMGHRDFMHLFYNNDNKCFYNIEERDELTFDDIKTFVGDNCVMHQIDDGGMIFGMHIVRIYRIDGKWVMFYRKRYFSHNTNTRYNDAEGIIVYKTINNLTKDDLPSHSSFDGRMQCWMY